MLHIGHPFFPTFKRLMAEAATHSPVYDLGTNARFAKEVGLVRSLFDERNYRAGGYRPDLSIGVDACDFDCDIQQLHGIRDAEAGSVLCISVLEHVQDPRRALNEIYRILQPGGIAVVSVPFFTPYHGKSGTSQNPVFDRSLGLQVDSAHHSYGDFWRFTHQGLACLFADAGFSRVDVYPQDGWLISRLQIMGLYNRMARIPLLLKLMSCLDKPVLGRTTTMHFIRAQK